MIRARPDDGPMSEEAMDAAWLRALKLIRASGEDPDEPVSFFARASNRRDSLFDESDED